MSQAWLQASALVWMFTAWGTGAFYPGSALGQQSNKTVKIPGDAYTAYEVPPGGADLRLTINRANTRLVIDDSDIQLQDTNDTVQWARSSNGPAAHVYDIGTVLSSREYVRIFGHYHYTNGVGAGPWPTFYVRVAAPDVDVAPLTAATDEAAEESVGVWLAKDGARRQVALSAVTCKGPENEQTLGWSSGQLQLWTAPTEGTMLSGSSESVSASEGGTYYAQGHQASESVRDAEITATYTVSGETAVDRVRVTVVGATTTPFTVMAVGQTTDVTVTLSPDSPGTNVTVSLSCLEGTGEARFWPSGQASTTLTASATLTVTGVTASSTASNLLLRVLLAGEPLVSNRFTIIRVDVDIDSDYDGDIQDDDDSIETSAGGAVPINSDDDDNDDNVDRDESSSITGEDDLQKINLEVEPTLTTGTVKLETVYSGVGRIAIWEGSNKTTSVSLTNTWDLSTDTVPSNLWIEGISPSTNGARDVELHLSYENGDFACTDTVAVTVCELFYGAFGHDGQTYKLPPTYPQSEYESFTNHVASKGATLRNDEYILISRDYS